MGMAVYHKQLKIGIVQGEVQGNVEVSFIGYSPNVIVEKGALELVNFADIANDYNRLVRNYELMREVYNGHS
jgi:hypothetical protein